MKWKMKKIDASNTAEILIYGDISTYDSGWGADFVTPQNFNDELKQLGAVDEIALRINSNGGDVFAGVAIHSMLKRHRAQVKVHVDGIAASIASVIAMAGDEIVMSVGSMLMIHNPWTFGMGNSKDFRKLADELDAISESMKDIYVARTNIKRDLLGQLLDAETWMSATEAVERGFATRIEEDSQPIAASLKDGKTLINGIAMDLSRFKNPPKFQEESRVRANTADILKENAALKAQINQQSQRHAAWLEKEKRRLTLLGSQ